MITPARRARPGCKAGERRWTVVRVNGDPSDTYAGRSFQQAMELAMPDRGAKIEVFTACGKDAGAARLAPDVHGILIRAFRYKRGG